jgi:hypothetical protein
MASTLSGAPKLVGIGLFLSQNVEHVKHFGQQRLSQAHLGTTDTLDGQGVSPPVSVNPGAPLKGKLKSQSVNFGQI